MWEQLILKNVLQSSQTVKVFLIFFSDHDQAAFPGSSSKIIARKSFANRTESCMPVEVNRIENQLGNWF